MTALLPISWKATRGKSVCFTVPPLKSLYASTAPTVKPVTVPQMIPKTARRQNSSKVTVFGGFGFCGMALALLVWLVAVLSQRWRARFQGVAAMQ